MERMEFTGTIRRNFLMHVWPASKVGAWQWNLDQVIERAELFNGRRVVAIATSEDADHPDAVKEYLRGFTDEFIIVENHRKLREVVSFVPLMERVESRDPNEVTFYCHSKGVRRFQAVDDPSTAIFRWTEMMYRTCLDNRELVEDVLTEYAMAGSFKRYGLFKLPHNNRWHYSGTFFWFRNIDTFTRDWRGVDQRSFGVEAWPGRIFEQHEGGCLFHNKCGNLYDVAYMNEIVQPAFEKWLDLYGAAVGGSGSV